MLISIIVPCFNQGEFLDEALASVYEQKHQDWECIIVNDGSIDKTEDVGLSWCRKDARFNYTAQNNLGLSAARNTGIRLAKGQYILPLDADDRINDSYVLEALNIFERQKGVTLVYCNAYRFGFESGPWDLQLYNYESLLIENMIFCSAIFKRADALKLGGYDENLKIGLEDWDFWIRLLTPVSIVIKLDIVGFYYRIKPESMATAMNVSIEKKNNLKENILLKNLNIYKNHFGSPFQLLEKHKQLKDFERKLKSTIIYKIFNYLRN